MKIGMTLIEIDLQDSRRDLIQMIRAAKEATPLGRQLCISFPLPNPHKDSLPYEAFITTEILGRPNERSEQYDWAFFGNICIRLCKVINDDRQVRGELGVVMFRRSGDMAYRKRDFVNQQMIEKATLNTLHPVFTRDVANNVWHLPIHYKRRLRNRLQSLFTWPDESTLLITKSTQLRLSWKPLILDDDLIGVPRKFDYPWASEALLHPRGWSGEAVL